MGHWVKDKEEKECGWRTRSVHFLGARPHKDKRKKELIGLASQENGRHSQEMSRWSGSCLETIFRSTLISLFFSILFLVAWPALCARTILRPLRKEKKRKVKEQPVQEHVTNNRSLCLCVLTVVGTCALRAFGRLVPWFTAIDWPTTPRSGQSQDWWSGQSNKLWMKR
jgi:hypothetical protein